MMLAVIILAIVLAVCIGMQYRDIQRLKAEAAELDSHWPKLLDAANENMESLGKEKDAAVMQSKELDDKIQALASQIAALIEERNSLLAAKERAWYPEGVPDLVEVARPFVEYHDSMAQSGEWKFHQIYAAVIKQNPEIEKWKIGLAIHLAVAERRLEESHV